VTLEALSTLQSTVHPAFMKGITLMSSHSEFSSREVIIVMIIYSREGNQKELVTISAYLPRNSNHHLQSRRCGMSSTTATEKKDNSSLRVMPMHTTSYG